MNEPTVERRQFGRADEQVSALGLGGYHLGVPEDPELAVEMVRTAIDGGITFMDNSWDYHSGESERRMGRALSGGYRDKVFLMTKLDSRSRDGTMRQLEESLQRLQTDHLDLLQLHEVIRPGDPAEALRDDGPIAAYLELKEQGVVRYIGFTGHKNPDYHREMIEFAAQKDIVFDAVQMPVNPFDANFMSFGDNVLPLCAERGIAALGMKPLGSGRLLGHGVEARDLLQWALSRPVSVVITGCESLADVEQAISVGRWFDPLPQEEMERIASLVAPEAADGHLEAYKTTDSHDGTADNEQWLA